jgi:hypothetical protein
VTLRISLGSALGALLLAAWFGACQQTLVLDDLSSDGGLPGTGGKGSGGKGGTGGGPSDASTDGRCFGGQGPEIQFTADVPQILVALDRSSAMNEPFGMNGPSQLQTALNAILAEVDSYSGSGRSSRRAIQFSFLDFPDQTALDCNAATGCCPSNATTSYSELNQEANACNNPPNASCLQSTIRPTAAALSKAHDYYAFGSGSQHSTERYVLLITDGDPEGMCPSTNPCGDAINTIGDLTNLGVTTEVVAIGTGATCLTDLATAQGLSPSPYYVAATSTDLSNMLDGIAQTVAQGGCRLTLATPPSGQLTVVFDNMVKQPDSGTSGNGWTNGGSNGTRVFLHGSLCQSFLQGSANSAFGLQIFDSCAPEHPGQNP